MNDAREPAAGNGPGTGPTSGRRRAREGSMGSDHPRWLSWLPEIVWLVVLWLLLWGSVTPLALLGGFVIAMAATWVARLPPQAPFAGRLRPVGFAVLVVDFLGDLLSSGVQVSWQAIRRGKPAGSAFVAVPVRAHSDGLLVIIADALSLTPGTVVVDYDTENRRLLVHGYPVRSHDEADDLRYFALRIEERVVRAVGPRRDLEAVEREEQR